MKRKETVDKLKKLVASSYEGSDQGGFEEYRERMNLVE